MTDDNYVIKINLTKTKFLLHTFIVTSFLFLFVFFIYNSEAAMYDHSATACAANHNGEHSACQMTEDGAVCNMGDMEIKTDKDNIESCNYEIGKRNYFQVLK